MTTTDTKRHDVPIAREVPAGEPLGLTHPGWAGAFPWLVQGTTTRGRTARPFDLGLFSDGRPHDEVRANWAALGRAAGLVSVVHARQVHGAEVRRHGTVFGGGVGSGMEEAGAGNGATVPTLVEPCDGHLTGQAGLLLAVTTADCVPVSIVDPGRRAVAALHAGWRGVAAGILERGLSAMIEAFGSDPSELHVHFGPSICGHCYEVGPEVFEALGRGRPSARRPIDLRDVLAGRARSAGVAPERTSVSAHCTRCTDSGLFSHRGGDPYRQVTYLGVRP